MIKWIIFVLFLSPVFSNATTFKFRLLAEPTTLDWNLASTSVETPLMMNLMEGLMEVDKNLKPIPCLAESMSISKDQKTYTFKLKKNIKWSDGVALKASDFVEGWKRLLTAETAASYAYLLYDVVGAEEYNRKSSHDFSKVLVHAKDDLTLEVHLIKPVAYFPYLMGFWPMFPIRKDIIDKEGASWTRPGKMVTVGPFVLDSYQLQTKIVMKKNPHYWRKMGNVTEVVAQIIKESPTALNLFKSGSLNMMQDFSPDDLKRVRPMPEFKTFPYLKSHYLAFRVKNTPMENVHMRLAVAHAINRKPIPSILNGAETVASTFIPPKVTGYDSKMAVDYSPEKAKEELKKSGLDPKKIHLQIASRSSDRSQVMAQYIQSEIQKNLGLSVEIQVFDHKMYKSQISTTDYAMMLMVWAADYPDGDTFMGLFESGTGNNFTHFADSKYDELIKRAREEWNSVKRDQLYRQAEDIIQMKEAAIVPLYYEQNQALVSKNVKGFTINPIGYFFFRELDL